MATSTLLRRGIDASRSRPDALVLAVVCVAQFMVVLDISIVNVALPDMKTDLHMSQNGLGVGAQRLHADVCRLPAAGRSGGRSLGTAPAVPHRCGAVLGDVAGRRAGADRRRADRRTRVCRASAARCCRRRRSTILTTTFTDPKARARALGMWSAVAGAGGATGVLAGGVLTDLLSWRWILFINVPIGIARLARRTLRDHGVPGRG